MNFDPSTTTVCCCDSSICLEKGCQIQAYQTFPSVSIRYVPVQSLLLQDDNVSSRIRRKFLESDFELGALVEQLRKKPADAEDLARLTALQAELSDLHTRIEKRIAWIQSRKTE